MRAPLMRCLSQPTSSSRKGRLRRWSLSLQIGSLSEAFRFAPRGKGQVFGHLERRKGVGPTELGQFMYDLAKGPLNTVALDGTIPADQIRLQVRL